MIYSDILCGFLLIKLFYQKLHVCVFFQLLRAKAKEALERKMPAKVPPIKEPATISIKIKNQKAATVEPNPNPPTAPTEQEASILHQTKVMAVMKSPPKDPPQPRIEPPAEIPPPLPPVVPVSVRDIEIPAMPTGPPVPPNPPAKSGADTPMAKPPRTRSTSSDSHR